MSKSKKIFSIALAILLLLQLFLVPTFAEETTTVTGKYTTADNLPLIYGAGESLDDFENVTLAETETLTNADTIIDAQRSFNGTKLSVVGSDVYTLIPRGSKVLKVKLAQNTGTGFYFKVKNFNGNDYTDELSTSHSLAFYIDIPANSATLDSWQIISTDVRDLWEINKSSTTSTLSDFTVTYYFKDGSKKVMENQSAIYAYDNTGAISSTGFKGYVAIDLKGKISTDNDYLVLKRITTKWEDMIYYFDDFRLVDSNVFLPYATIQDFESVEAKADLKNTHYSSAGLWVSNDCAPDVNIVDTGAAQGTTALQFKTTKWGTIRMNLMLKSSSAHKGIAFYVSIPAKGWYGTPKFTLGFSKNYWDTSAVESLGSATYTYYFEDGSTLVKYGDDGIYPYDKNGDITAGQAFTGYVSIYYGNNDLSTNPYLHITVPENNSSALQQSGGYIYLDDFRFCDYNTAADIVSGDAYYINDTAVPVQKVGDTATLSVMTNLATLGMARNAEGLEALRKVLLEEVTKANKHKVNSDENVDIRDLVALYKLSAS